MAEHESHVKSYFMVFGLLLVLTAVTVAVAFVDLGSWGGVVAVTIACVKATAVVMVFMHLHYETKLVKLYAASGVMFLIILFAITMGEYAGRKPQPPDVLGPPTGQLPDAPAHAEHPAAMPH